MRNIEKVTQRKIDDILVETGHLEAEVMQDIITELGPDAPLEMYLLEQNIIDESILAEVISNELHLPFISAANYEITPELIKTIPAGILYKYNFIPLEKVGNVLIILMGSIPGIYMFDELKKITADEIFIFVGSLTEIRALLREHTVSEEVANTQYISDTDMQTDVWQSIFDDANEEIQNELRKKAGYLDDDSLSGDEMDTMSGPDDTLTTGVLTDESMSGKSPGRKTLSDGSVSGDARHEESWSEGTMGAEFSDEFFTGDGFFPEETIDGDSLVGKDTLSDKSRSGSLVGKGTLSDQSRAGLVGKDTLSDGEMSKSSSLVGKDTLSDQSRAGLVGDDTLSDEARPRKNSAGKDTLSDGTVSGDESFSGGENFIGSETLSATMEESEISDPSETMSPSDSSDPFDPSETMSPSGSSDPSETMMEENEISDPSETMSPSDSSDPFDPSETMSPSDTMSPPDLSSDESSSDNFMDIPLPLSPDVTQEAEGFSDYAKYKNFLSPEMTQEVDPEKNEAFHSEMDNAETALSHIIDEGDSPPVKLNKLAVWLQKNPCDYDALNKYVEVAISNQNIFAAIKQLTVFAKSLIGTEDYEGAASCYEYVLELDSENQEAQEFFAQMEGGLPTEGEDSN